MIFTEKITSRNNDRIKFAVRVKEKESFRRSEGLFLIEGARLCYDAALSDVSIAELYVTADAREKYVDYVTLIEDKANRCIEVSHMWTVSLPIQRVHKAFSACVKCLTKAQI